MIHTYVRVYIYIYIRTYACIYNRIARTSSAASPSLPRPTRRRAAGSASRQPRSLGGYTNDHHDDDNNDNSNDNDNNDNATTTNSNNNNSNNNNHNNDNTDRDDNNIDNNQMRRGRSGTLCLPLHLGRPWRTTLQAY